MRRDSSRPTIAFSLHFPHWPACRSMMALEPLQDSGGFAREARWRGSLRQCSQQPAGTRYGELLQNLQGAELAQAFFRGLYGIMFLDQALQSSGRFQRQGFLLGFGQKQPGLLAAPG